MPIVEILLQKGARIDEKSKKGFTPLHFAVSKGYKQIVEMLIKHDANLEIDQDPRLFSLLHIATGKGFIEIVEMLITKGVKLDEKDAFGCTPLILAIFQGKSLMVAMLVRYGASLKIRNEDGLTPLEFALNQYDNMYNNNLKHKKAILYSGMM